MIWYTEAWSLDPVAIRRLLEETSQHMTEVLSGTWEDQGAQHGGVTHPGPYPCLSVHMWSLWALCTGTPGLSTACATPGPPWYLELHGSCRHAVDADQVVHPHAHPPLAWKEAEGHQVKTGS